MPSLNALEKFKSSFKTLGLELQTLNELDLPFDDLPLPDKEPANEPPPAAEPEGAEAAAPEEPGGETYPPPEAEPSDGTDLFGDLSDLLGGGAENLPVDEVPGETDLGEPFPYGQEDSDLDNFIDTIPDDFATDEPPTEVPGAEASGIDDIPPNNEISNGEGKTPPGLLNGFADEIEAERASKGKKGAKNKVPDEDFSDQGLGDLDLSNLGPANEDIDSQNLDEFALPEQGQEDQDTGLPDFDLDSLMPSAEETPDGTGADTAAEAEGTDNADMGLPDFPDFDNAENMEQLYGEDTPDDQGKADTDLSSNDSAGFDLGDIPDFSDNENQEPYQADETSDTAFADAFGEFPSDATTEDTGAMNVSGLDLGDIPDFGGPESPMPPPAGESASFDTSDTESDEDGFDFAGGIPDAGAEATLEDISEDGFDSFSPDSGSFGDGFDDMGSMDDFGSLDDFGIPGLDTGFDTTAPGKGKAPGKKGKASRGDANEVEEISLTMEELEQFQETLSSYPLNLRIACEELIAEKAVVPEQMSRLIGMLIEGAPAAETAALAGKLLDKPIPIPKGYEKRTGEDLEAEQSSFAYIFVHNFLPVLRLFGAIALVILSAGYLSYRYIYMPIKAEKIYKLGIERIDAGEYSRANERFLEAYRIHPKKPWFYTYARAFRDSRQYILAEEKYRELLNFTAAKNKRGIPEKAAVLEYADLETNYIGDYQTADSIIRRNILDYFPMDKDALLALGDNSLIWGEYEKERLEDAREAYAMLIERYGRTDPLLERMLKYFIRTDNLGQVLPLQSYFMYSEKRIISAATLAEMAGYFMDKRLEKVRGVPNEYLDQIGGIREILIRAIKQDPRLPESYYHLARYYNYFENSTDERLTLEVAVRAFEAAKEESPKRIGYHINALRRYAEVLINGKEFFPAEESLIKGINVYQDGLSRRLLTRSPEYGRLYADLGDLEFFVKDGDMQTALDYYNYSEQNGWAPPEIQYRMGAAHYQLRQWGPALERLFSAFREVPQNRRILYALGNVSYMRGNYFAAQGYYDRLLEILEDDRSRLPPIAPTDDEDQLDLVERLMVAQNNLGVVLEALTERTGNTSYRSRAQGLYSDSERAWDILTRNPTTMIRMRPSPDITAPSVNPAYLNVQNSLRPIPGYEHQFFLRIDKDVLEPSAWEDLAPSGFRLSEGIHTGR
jgi:tetratricopeptide (TPR) repeat protein